MIIYDRWEDIPYEVLRQSGEFGIRDPSSLPPEFLSYNKAVGILPPQLSQTLSDGPQPEPEGPWVWWMYVAVIAAATIFTAVVGHYVLSTITVIRSAPEGRKDTLADGTEVYITPDGSTWFFREDGSMYQAGGSTELDIQKILSYAAILIIVAVLAYVFVKVGLPMLKAKGQADPGG